MATKDEAKTAEGETKIEKVEAKISAEAQKLYEKIDAWFVKHFHGNRIAADTDSFNIAHAAKEDLKKLLS